MPANNGALMTPTLIVTRPIAQSENFAASVLSAWNGPLNLIISPLISVWSFLYDGVYVGATRAREMRNLMLISTFVIFLPAWFLLQGFGNHGLWLAFTLFMASRGIGMHIWYQRRILPRLNLQ